MLEPNSGYMTLLIDEDSMSVQYPGSRAATLGVIIHRHPWIPHLILLHRFTQPGLSPVLLPWVCICGTMIFKSIENGIQCCTSSVGSRSSRLRGRSRKYGLGIISRTNRAGNRLIKTCTNRLYRQNFPIPSPIGDSWGGMVEISNQLTGGVVLEMPVFQGLCDFTSPL